MKFRRGIAKLLVAVTIVELILSSMNRNEYVVMAATDEVTQSEVTEEARTEESAIAQSVETTESIEDDTEEVVESTETENTETENTETTTEDIVETETESETEEDNKKEDAIEGESETTTESTTEESTESIAKDATKDATEEIVNGASESNSKNVQDGLLSENYNVQLMSEEDESTTANVPDNINNLNKDEYYITSYQDWLNLQELCRYSDLKGKTFKIGLRNNLEYYDFRELESDNAFVGIGSKEHPFSGTLSADYTSGISLKTNSALFQYLSTDAQIYGLTIEPYDTNAGLAENLVVSETNSKFVELNNITISNAGGGIVGAENETAGGLFANVVNETGNPFVLQGTKVTVNASVSGDTAGGLIGSMTGSITLVMDGGIQCAPAVKPLGTSSTIGGWIGNIDANDGNITIQSGGADQITYTFQEASTTAAGITGGLFGNVDRATINIDNALVISNGLTSSSSSQPSQYDLYGITAGAFVGKLEECVVNLKAGVQINRTRIAQNSTNETEMGIGGFVGVMKNSTMTSATESGTITIESVCVWNKNSATTAHNIGGLVGYADNSLFSFSKAGCTIHDFSSRKTYGNVAGAIGFYQADSSKMKEENQVAIAGISVTGTTTSVAITGNAAGLVGCMYLTDCCVTMQDCYGENLCYGGSTTASKTKVSLGIGTVSSQQSSAKLRLTGIVLKGILSQSSGAAPYKHVFGGMIGSADIDLEISGKITSREGTDDELYDTAVCYGCTSTLERANYFGGLIGEVCQSGTEYRKVDISNVLAGCTDYANWLMPSLTCGGLFGRVEDRTSVCLDGKINLNGGTAVKWIKDKNTGKDTVSIGAQILDLHITNYAGSVVGTQNYSLIYLQPTGKLIKSTYTELNEIGNYGGIFRNGNWDTGNYVNENWTPTNQDEANWLIQNHEVTGDWQYLGMDNTKNCAMFRIKTPGDFMRLAIFGNTCDLTDGAGFYTTSVSIKEELEDIYELIYNADFYLDPVTYDLTETGIVSLYRNDAVDCLVQNSLICNGDTKAVIKYTITDYGQCYVGLFPAVDGSTKQVEFKNLKLEYTFELKIMQYKDAKYSATLDRSVSQYIGGLAAKVFDNVEVSDVTYEGIIHDEKKPGINRYVGGLFAEYRGQNTSTFTSKLSIFNLNADFDCTYKNKKNVVSAVIGRIYTDDSYRCDVEMQDISISGSIIANQSSNSEGLKQSGLITIIYSYENKDIYSNFNISDVSIQDFAMGVSEECKSLSYPYIGGFLGYSWNCVKVNLNNVNIGTDTDADSETMASISANVQNFGGLVHDVRGKMLINGFNYGENTSFDILEGGENSGLLIQNGQYLYLDVADYSVTDVKLLNYTGEYFDELVGYNKGGDSTENGGIVSIRTSDSSYLGKNNTDYNSYGYGYHVINEDGNYVQMQNCNTRYYYDLNDLDYCIDYTTIDSPEALMVWHLMHYANDYIIDECLRTNNEDAMYSSKKIPTSYTITENIDMTGYSIYPTTLLQYESYTATAGVAITFNAQAIYAGENGLYEELLLLRNENKNFVVKYPEDYLSQHYQMHAGLFNNIWSGVDVTGLTLTGTYSVDNYYGSGTYRAGALVCGSIYGVELDETGSQGETLYDDNVKSNFNDIVFKDLWCVSDQGKLMDSTSSGDGNSEDSDSEDSNPISLDNPIGLMIAHIAAGAKVNMDGIQMTGYSDQDVNVGYKAASALIGVVGNENATYISLTFKNMDIMDAATGKSSESLNSKKCEEALGRASFIYEYNYKENCSAIYTFTSKDYLVGKLEVVSSQYGNYKDDGFVTLGYELGNQTYKEYGDKKYAEILYYDNEDPVGRASAWLQENGTTVDTDATEITFNCENYLPYVCVRHQEILVNPKIADIQEGCGTYEDPYIISTTTQLITIYRYLYEEDIYKDVLGMSGNEWKIHATGNDGYICDGTNSPDQGHGGLLSYEQERSDDSDFPTKEELSQAYYVITEDIDLSKYTDFIGFGREEMPFIGVFIGEGNDDTGKSPNITMLEAPNSTLSQYAFIQVAKGVVIKDLTFCFGSTVKIEGTGAGVIATVKGGDNIIDNVTVKSSAEDTVCFLPAKETTVIGGYVGVVELGGVILRNMDANSLSGFSISGNPTSYPYIGSIIGRVLDGYVIYDGEEDEDGEEGAPALFEITATAEQLKNQELPLCSTYDILNGAYLSSAKNGIKWTGKGFEIYNNKQLQIISMALNSGMLNYDAEYEDEKYGYGSDSRQRNGNYDYVGKITEDSKNEVYADVVKGDNASTFADSYLWQYFSPTESLDSESMLEAANTNGLNPLYMNADEILTYELTGTEYDMSVFQMGFRGLGARYHCTDYVSPYGNNTRLADTTLLFKSHFVGSDEDPVVITLDMTVTEAMDSRRAGLLNEVPNTGVNTTVEMLIQNITLKGTVENEGANLVYDAGNGYYTPVENYNAGGFMSDAVTKLNFENVSLMDLDVEATGYAGGLVGHVKEFLSSDTTVKNITLDELTVVGGCDSKGGEPLTEGVIEGHAGGLIGKFQSVRQGGSSIYIGDANTTENDEEESLNGVKGNKVTVYTRGRNSAAAGLVGYIECLNNGSSDANFYNTEMRNLSVYTKNAYATGWNQSPRAGGIVGYGYQIQFCFEDVTIGSEKTEEKVVIALKNDNIDATNPVSINAGESGAGGLIGQSVAYSGSPNITITDCQILGAIDASGDPTVLIQGYNNVGGIIGKKFGLGNCKIQNSTVAGASIKGLGNIGGCVGTISGSGQLILENIEVQECDFMVNDPSTSNGMSLTSIAGYTGGLIGCYWSTTHISNCKVVNNTISPANSHWAGGFAGKAGTIVFILGKNEITENVICGDIAGGVFGLYETSSTGSEISHITISKNRIVSMMQSDQVADSSTDRAKLAGGFAGKIYQSSSSSAFGCVENIVIEENLIAGSNSLNNVCAGGVVGLSYSNTNFYDIKLRNNYIGLLKNGELLRAASYYATEDNTTEVTPEDIGKMIVSYLEKTDMDTVKTKLYWRTSSSTQNDDNLCSIQDVNGKSEEEYYNCSYGMGAIAGRISYSTDRCNNLVNVNIQYADNSYRPVFDVGMTSVVSNTKYVYESYRGQYNIVYDSMNVEEPWEDGEYCGFSNLELIYDRYCKTKEESADSAYSRYAYRLNYDYLAGKNSTTINIASIYEGTYQKDNSYISDFKTSDGKTLPLVIFRTTDYGSLDEVLQSYVNILTNNSGAVNTYTNQEIEVTTTRKVLKDGVIEDDPEKTATVQVVKLGNNKYKFSNETTDEDGNVEHLYDQMTDECNVSFTVVRISYQYNGNEKWALEIPVYVEQELEFDSHMRFVKGIEYNVNTVKNGSYYNTEKQSLTDLDRGDSYTLYLEYVYGEARKRYTDAYIPKSISMECETEGNTVTFFEKTQLTLIDLKNGGKPYYYTAEPVDGNTIDFTKFKDSEGNFYSPRLIRDCTEYTDFTDVCGETKTNVAVENYLLLVDTSQVETSVKEQRGNVVYNLHTDISQLEKENPLLYNRIEYTEDCYVRINEIIGISCSFVEDDDLPDLNGTITEGGSVTLTMEYNMKVTAAWKNANKNNPTYLDIAISLQKKVNNSTQKIPLPEGTQVYFEELKDDLTYKRLDSVYVVQGGSISDVYYYADSSEAINLLNLDADKQYDKTIRVILDFSMADMSAFENVGSEEEYGFSADLVLFTDKDDPADCEVRDSFYGTVQVDVVSELGFAFQPDELITLGMNRYQPEDTDTGIVSFKAQIAFPDDSKATDIQSKNYSIVYKIEEKSIRQNGTDDPVYQPYTGDQISLYMPELKDGNEVTIYQNDEEQYYIIPSLGSLTVTSQSAETSFILKAEEGLDFSNYRITGYLIISDEEMDEEALVNEVLENSDDLNTDFFVYTVAKIKTDLNINTDLTSSTSLN